MKKAFSLIELSIVILIIGILIAGVTQGTILVNAMRLQTARAMTQSAPVNSIKNLVAWYETTSSESFDDSEEEDSLTITNWYDINLQSAQKNNLTSVTSKATYVRSGQNGIPVLRFSGATGMGYANTTATIDNEMTTFAVVQNSSTGFRRFISLNAYFFIGISSGSTEFAAFYGNGTAWNHTGSFGSDAALTSGKFFVVSSSINAAGLNKGYVNGVDVGTPAVTPETKISGTGYNVGCNNLSGCNQAWFGDIGEIIIYNRALKDAERKDIEKYLGKKWGISVS